MWTSVSIGNCSFAAGNIDVVQSRLLSLLVVDVTMISLGGQRESNWGQLCTPSNKASNRWNSEAASHQETSDFHTLQTTSELWGNIHCNKRKSDAIKTVVGGIDNMVVVVLLLVLLVLL